MTELISESYDLSFQTLKYMNGMSTNLYNTDVNSRKSSVANFKNNIVKTYSLILYDQVIQNTTILNAVRSLNNHVLNTYKSVYGYETIDQFLQNQYLQVPTSYAALSDLVGFDIQNIGNKKCAYEDIDDNYEDIELDYALIGWENL
jgi:hypothetical protein